MVGRVVAALLVAQPVLRASAEELSAQDIVKRTTDRNTLGFESGVADVRLVLRDRNGGEQTQRIVSSAQRSPNRDVSSVLIRYEAPADVRGTKFLLIDRTEPQPDDMFIFLPELKRTRRITGAQRNSAFMGSDFSYADMQSLDIKEGSYERRPDRRLDDVNCYVIQVAPKRLDSEYKQILLTVRKDNFLPATIEYTGTDGGLMKAFKSYESKNVDGFWIVSKSQMWNKKTGHSTIVMVDKVSPKEPVEANLFHPETLGQ